jgi:hypothetical protein
LRDVYKSPLPDFAWHASALTGDGFPLEVAFASNDRVIRYTAAASAPELAAEVRISDALMLVEELGGHAVPPEVARGLRAMQAGATAGNGLRYGAWVGGRHEGASASNDRFKLYVEVPEGRSALPLPLPMCQIPIPQLSDRRVHLRMVGYEPATGTHEIYYRVARAMSYHVYHLLRQAGLDHQTTDLLDVIGQAYSRPLHDEIPGGAAGCSYTLAPGRPAVLTLFLFARALWGGDRRILCSLRALAAARGWELGAYQQVAAPLAARDLYQTYHGMVGFVVAPQRPIQLTIGLRPPPTRKEAERAGHGNERK